MSSDASSDPTLVAPPAGADPAEHAALRPEVRQRLLRQFEQWVERMLAGEPPPAGLPEEVLEEAEAAGAIAPFGTGEEACDLYTLFAALTTLSGEIRLQGRAFKQLTDALAPLADVPAQLERLGTPDDLQPGEAGELFVSSNDICEVMLDLYDRLERGLRTFDHAIASLRGQEPGLLRRWMGLTPPAEEAAASAEAIRDTVAMTLGRLDSALHDWGIQRIGRIGEPFDPSRMTVVHVRADPDAEPATVLEVNRSGYALGGQIKKTARVTVARAESTAGEA